MSERLHGETGGAAVIDACGEEDGCNEGLAGFGDERGGGAVLARESKSEICRGFSCTIGEWAWEIGIETDGDSWDSQVEAICVLDLGRLTSNVLCGNTDSTKLTCLDTNIRLVSGSKQ